MAYYAYSATPSRKRLLHSILLTSLCVQAPAETADDLFSKFLAASFGWRDFSGTTSMTTRMMGRTTTMQSRIAMDKFGRTDQEVLSGPVRVAMVIRGGTIQSKDLQSGKIETRVLPSGGAAAFQQMDPGTRLFAIRQANRFQIESKTSDILKTENLEF